MPTKPLRGTPPPSPLAGEVSRADDPAPAQVQVVPVESLLSPGQDQQFQVRLYNAKGQWLRNAEPDEVSFSIGDGTGEMSETGRYSLDSSIREHAAVTVTAEVGGLTGTARVRVVPPLDWKFDFDDGQIPITWVGARYRHIPLDFDLLTKLDREDPRAAQLYIYLTTDFVNFDRTESVYDDTTPAQRWTETLRFLNLLEEGVKPKNADEAKELLGLSLKQLIGEKILEDYEFTSWQRDLGNGNSVSEVRLTVTRGERRG